MLACGDGYKGKLGQGHSRDLHSPAGVQGLEGVVQVVAGGIHSAALDRYTVIVHSYGLQDCNLLQGGGGLELGMWL